MFIIPTALQTTKYSRQIFGRKLETPVGPAAGPRTHTAGSDLQLPTTEAAVSFEPTTVQILDGEGFACQQALY